MFIYSFCCWIAYKGARSTRQGSGSMASLEECSGRMVCRTWREDWGMSAMVEYATKERSTQISFWWFKVTPSKHQNEFPSVPPVNSAYSIQSDAVENESYQSSPKYPSRQVLFYHFIFGFWLYFVILFSILFGTLNISIYLGLMPVVSSPCSLTYIIGEMLVVQY